MQPRGRASSTFLVLQSNQSCEANWKCTNRKLAKHALQINFLKETSTCHVTQVHHGNNHVVSAYHLQVLVKKSHVVTTYQVNTVQTTAQNFLSTVCNWLKNKNSVSLTAFLNVNSVTCLFKRLKQKKAHLVSTSWYFLNVVLITLFTVLV